MDKASFYNILKQAISRKSLPGALVIIYGGEKHNKTFLLLKTKGKHFFSFASGRLNWGENFEQGAKRELQEETGIRADKILPLPLIHSFVYDLGLLKLGSFQKVFVLRMDNLDKVPINQKEGVEYRWLNTKEVLGALSHKELKETFLNVLKYLN